MAHVELWRNGRQGVMSPQSLAVLAALCGTVVLAAVLGWPIENSGAPIEGSWARSVTERVDAAPATVQDEDGISVAAIRGSSASLPAPRPMPAVRIASLSSPV